MHALTAYPDYFSGAVIISSNTGLVEAEEKAGRLRADHGWAEQALADWDIFLSDWLAQPVFAGDAVLPGREELMTWRSEIASAFDVWSLAKQDDLLTRLPDVICPVLWVTGQRDARFTRIAAVAAAAMRSGEHVIVESAGHRVPWDQPVKTTRLIGEFLLKLAHFKGSDGRS